MSTRILAPTLVRPAGSRSRRSSRRQQHGAIIVTAALTLLLLLGFMGIALDFGRLFIVRTELQTALDSCALAAARELNKQPDAISRAVSAGAAAGNLNGVNLQSTNWSGQGQITAADVSFRDASYLSTTSATAAVISYALGYTTTKEYAEMEWPFAIALTVLWVTYAWLFFGTILQRKTSHIYVANWFYGAFIIVTAMVHIINHAAIPVTLLKSYPLYSGATDAMVQWWFGHSVVGFILSVGFLGMMYYFVPKQVNRPIYSYRLSIVHFWAIISIYIWAGPHHLHYTALPDWAQSLGMAMSIILLAPSWGGMINGMMTLSGAWHKLRSDPILRFLVVALAFYGMSTFEGPMMAIKTVNSLSHYTDWTIGHVHAGALGWVAMISFGSLYHMIPKLWDHAQMYSTRLINVHFWLATAGTVIYIAAMWVNGLTQGLMWRAINDDGTLSYSFVEVLEASHAGYIARLIGGSLFVLGMLLMVVNTWLTLRRPAQQSVQQHLNDAQTAQV